ncbi:MAG: hypothetical protein R6V86_04705 [Spirochaetia bacterium]
MSDDLYTLLKQHNSYLQDAYKHYSLAVQDEGFRKFLNSMHSQEKSQQETVDEHAAEISSCSAHNQTIADLISQISDIKIALEEVRKLPRLKYLEHMLEMGKYTGQLYKKSEAVCQSPQLKELLHSLYEEEKRHIALLEDRFELEQLL